MADAFKIIDGDIFMGKAPIIGHGCKTLAEKESYCAEMNSMVDEEYVQLAKENREGIAKLSPKARKDILDVLGDDWRHD